MNPRRRTSALSSALGTVLGLALVVVTTGVRADAIGPCPDGEHVVMNPSSPGAMHHGGFHCEPDPGRCSVAAPGAARAPAGAWAGALALLGVSIAARRRR
jgi:hypothetical protein